METNTLDTATPALTDWLTLDEAQVWLGLKTKQERLLFRKAIKEGEIPAMRLTNKTIRLHKPTLRARFAVPD